MNSMTIAGAVAGAGVGGFVGYIGGGLIAWSLGANDHHKTGNAAQVFCTAACLILGGYGGKVLGNEMSRAFSHAAKPDTSITVSQVVRSNAPAVLVL